MWNCTPQASRPSRNASLVQTGELASWIAPGGRSMTASTCHWITSGVIGVGPNSGSVAALARLAISWAPYSGPSGLRATRPPVATASSWAPRQMPSVGTSRATASASSRRIVAQIRVGGVVVGPHRAAEHDQTLGLVEVGRQPVARERPDDLEVEPGGGQPVAQRADRVGGLGFDHEDGHADQRNQRAAAAQCGYSEGR